MITVLKIVSPSMVCLLALLAAPCSVFAGSEKPWWVQAFAPDSSFIVLNDGNNLRQWGGPDYAKAPVITVLNGWDEVTVLKQDGRWAEVQTADGRHGFVNSACLAPYADIVSGKKAVANFPDREACVFSRKLRTRFLAALDRDGKEDVITLRCAPWRGNPRMFMTVTGSDGRIRYQGPTSQDSPLIFHMSEGGAYWPELIGDIDHDGRAELLVLHAPSDDRVTGHTLMRWNGQGFDMVSTNSALIEDAPQSGMFAFVPNPEGHAPEGRCAIVEFRSLDREGRLEAVVEKNDRKGGARVTSRGTGLFEAVEGGFRLERWIAPLAKATANHETLKP